MQSGALEALALIYDKIIGVPVDQNLGKSLQKHLLHRQNLKKKLTKAWISNGSIFLCTLQCLVALYFQGSWFVQGLLFELCEEINRIGGHALNR